MPHKKPCPGKTRKEGRFYFVQGKGRNADMRRNRKDGIKKERIVMVASSAFVLAALTLTGVYMNGQNEDLKDDGYTLDFSELESQADDKLEEIAGNDQIGNGLKAPVPGQPGNSAVNNSEYSLNNGNATANSEVAEGELDYMPLEVGSGQIQIPGLTDGLSGSSAVSENAQERPITAAKPVAEEPKPLEEAERAAEPVAVMPEKTLSYAAENGLLRPLSGEVLIHYSMSSSVYFATLDQYKYNPAVIISAAEGTAVKACAQGKVVSVYEDTKIGNAVILELGNGYQATYGQLTGISVAEGSYVDEGDILASVAAPTKYYSVEGNNLYFALTKDGVPVNPEAMFR